MTDIVERLQALGRCEHDDFSLGFEAADEIERLRQRVAELEKENENLCSALDIADQEYRLLKECDDLTVAYMSGFHDGKKAALKAGQGEPVAWRTFDGEGGYSLRVYEDNETYRDDYIKRNGERYRDWVQPLYTSAQTIPEGWVMMPKEPDYSLLLKMTNDRSNEWELRARASYYLLLAAAPKP